MLVKSANLGTNLSISTNFLQQAGVRQHPAFRRRHLPMPLRPLQRLLPVQIRLPVASDKTDSAEADHLQQHERHRDGRGHVLRAHPRLLS